MKKLIIALAVCGISAPAFASSELQSYCEAYVAESGGDVSGCACLGDEADADVAAELLAVQSEADVEGLSDAAKEAIAACFPNG